MADKDIKIKIKALRDRINNMGSYFEFNYPNEFGKNKMYTLKKHKSITYKLYYTVSTNKEWEIYDGMCVDKIGKKSLYLYGFDMMGTETTYKMKFELMEEII